MSCGFGLPGHPLRGRSPWAAPCASISRPTACPGRSWTGRLGLIEKLGAEVRLRTRLGRDVHLEELRRDFAAVFLAVGCHKSLLLEAPGENLTRSGTASDFLRAANSGPPPAVGPRVAVIGGGNTALDAARTA